MRRTLRRSFVGLVAGLVAGAVALAACSNSPSTPGSAGSSTALTTGTLAPQTPTGTEFLSPSRNISCEIDYVSAPSSLTSALCLTISPPRSVTLKPDGTLTECHGVRCLSNAGQGTPTLRYGMSVSLGPFTCLSSTSGVRCTLANGDGFHISSARTMPLGHATVTSGTG
jgi:hypothetical protein